MFVSTVMLRGLIAEVVSRNLPPEPILAAAGITAERLADIRGGVSLDEWGRALRSAIDLTGEEALGLELGAKAPENMLQLVGHLVLSAGSIREAFALFTRYASLLASGVSYALEERQDRALFRMAYDIASPSEQSARFGVEYSLVFAARIGGHFANQQRLIEVWFAHEAPEYKERYEQLFGCPVRFGQPYNALFFPRQLLDTPHLHGDDTMRSVLRDAAEQLLSESQRGVTIAERLRALLRGQRDLTDVDTELLARRLGLTRRSLRRRLRTEGITLSTIMDEERCRVACHELSRPNSCIKETAERLGYSEPSAFHRAFKRWTGKTPAQYSRMPQAAE